MIRNTVISITLISIIVLNITIIMCVMIKLFTLQKLRPMNGCR